MNWKISKNIAKADQKFEIIKETLTLFFQPPFLHNMWYLQQQQQVNIIVATMASKNQYCGPTQGWKHHQRQRFGNEWYLYQTIVFEYTVNLYDVFLYLGVM